MKLKVTTGEEMSTVEVTPTGDRVVVTIYLPDKSREALVDVVLHPAAKTLVYYRGIRLKLPEHKEA